METVFEKLFDSIQKDLQKNLAAAQKNTLADSSKPLSLGGSGTIPFSFHLDSQGNYHYEVEKYGAGKTVHFCAWIDDPDATYNVTVHSSDGGGGHWENVSIKEKKCGTIGTSFWHKTKITIDLHASVTNRDGHGTLEYSY